MAARDQPFSIDFEALLEYSLYLTTPAKPSWSIIYNEVTDTGIIWFFSLLIPVLLSLSRKYVGGYNRIVIK